ncbi:TPA: hypothetical protein QBQ37_005126 [Pseudomonas aeruginosa]|uniref:hypothetical protein n=1 Tax=Pseudomonas aeruginosa TaxID=287 RepID=UPI001A3161F2|nr:hypothetical protein [Pseudomonas aeruginosa]MBG7027433.1 hypothetical protein [Pseudomonas aeruginosa]MBG7370028.1 hypothetical protein [Pseudomonas aeruginosa]MBM9931853.1 hypothetical protein [Pseudomonas aeruginosa]HBN8097954.1 hypothetical protein [Pseudomonas aeruginosa]
MRKRELQVLENVFVAEIEGRLPFQTKSKIAQDLAERGFLQRGSRMIGRVEVSGYYLTHAGRYAYCASCPEPEEL